MTNKNLCKILNENKVSLIKIKKENSKAVKFVLKYNLDYYKEY